MKIASAWIGLLTWLTAATISNAAELVVIYPRTPAPDTPVMYADSLDSTFVFGHLDPPEGALVINGSTVPYTSQGAFLAFLPLGKTPETKQWDLTLIEGGRTIASACVPYLFRSELPPLPDTASPVNFPRIIRVAEDNTHTRTAPGGGYHLFPVKGTPLLAVGAQDGFFEYRLTSNTTDFIERRFVTVEKDTILLPVRIGDGRCISTRDSCVCWFAVSRFAPWSAELSSDGKSLDVTVYDARLALDRFQHTPGGYVEEAKWAQDGDDVRLTVRFLQSLTRGYEVTITGDSLTIIVRTPFRRSEHSLRGKRVAIDAGHGGAADGTVGPLGTREKDVTLRWARLVARELKRRGAVPILTRDSDVDVALPERVAIARQNRADLMISLHANALPDGINPFVKHGTGTYYYQPLSREVAEILHRHLLKASGLDDDGIYDANFAVVRPTAFPSVLLEAAYLMYPPEEELLRSDTYLRRLAKGVVKGMAEYFKRQS